ncbi:hypothetical protein RRG08_045699 [Elysia crispata]|uniref:Uncharacterized protein n=1 Tax=Elysia crispata TaxID=231223 RepID=A0AAE0Z427_9GAST|nr:hypothetical protein RRG08_045699 [Elysia crispata]
MAASTDTAIVGPVGSTSVWTFQRRCTLGSSSGCCVLTATNWRTWRLCRDFTFVLRYWKGGGRGRKERERSVAGGRLETETSSLLLPHWADGHLLVLTQWSLVVSAISQFVIPGRNNNRVSFPGYLSDMVTVQPSGDGLVMTSRGVGREVVVTEGR